MAKACSICFIETTNLIPLFSKYNTTTLSKIVKSMKKTKIKIADRPTSVICLTCIEQCIRLFKNQQLNNYLSTSHQPSKFLNYLSILNDILLHYFNNSNEYKSHKSLCCLLLAWK